MSCSGVVIAAAASYDPPIELRIPRQEVRDCHLVVGVDQEG
jgi:hypothetical protein